MISNGTIIEEVSLGVLYKLFTTMEVLPIVIEPARVKLLKGFIMSKKHRTVPSVSLLQLMLNPLNSSGSLCKSRIPYDIPHRINSLPSNLHFQWNFGIFLATLRYGLNILWHSSISFQYSLSTKIHSPKYFLLFRTYSALPLYKIPQSWVMSSLTCILLFRKSLSLSCFLLLS